MPDFATQERANALGIATINVQHNKSGIIWVVSQISVESSPVRPAANVAVTRNGRPMTTTAVVPATASGQPFYRLNASDILTLTYRNLTSGDTAIATISYSETLWGQFNDGSVI